MHAVKGGAYRAQLWPYGTSLCAPCLRAPCTLAGGFTACASFDAPTAVASLQSHCRRMRVSSVGRVPTAYVRHARRPLGVLRHQQHSAMHEAQQQHASTSSGTSHASVASSPGAWRISVNRVVLDRRRARAVARARRGQISDRSAGR